MSFPLLPTKRNPSAPPTIKNIYPDDYTAFKKTKGRVRQRWVEDGALIFPRTRFRACTRTTSTTTQLTSKKDTSSSCSVKARRRSQKHPRHVRSLFWSSQVSSTDTSQASRTLQSFSSKKKITHSVTSSAADSSNLHRSSSPLTEYRIRCSPTSSSECRPMVR